MLFWTIVKVAVKSLLANKLRSVLAMLGIIIGVAAVISMLALGAGAQKRIMDRISSMGANLMIVRPGQAGHRGVRSGSSQTLTLEDARALLDEVPEVKTVAPVVQGNGQFKYYGKNAQSAITGTSITYFSIRNFEVEKGRTFTESEVEQAARVAILGATTVENLFEDADPLQEKIKISGINFKVIGVLKAKGDQGWFNPDDQAIIPYTTAMKQILGVDYLREIDMQTIDDADHEKVQTEASKVIRRRHRIQSEDDDDFHIRDLAEMAETASEVTQTFTLLLGAVAGISLVVGGIGIMNIMLVS
ncbi:MAG: ABC transporter permease, partial [Candidatus Coatesbacteria bacterium]|nr:ABC transporter permease [Candidatus Coatesbacteria bacterium]